MYITACFTFLVPPMLDIDLSSDLYTLFKQFHKVNKAMKVEDCQSYEVNDCPGESTYIIYY